MKKYYPVLAFIFVSVVSPAFGQQEKENAIDPSKPTNFYSSINNAFEFSARESGGNQIGYRANLVLSPSERHLFLGELPLLYNTRSKNFGIGDIRARYFYLPYKNYEKFFGAFGPSIDIIAPTGSAANGIGSGRWTIAPGVAMGLMFADWIQVFPIVSYQYISKPVKTDTSALNSAINGGSLQFVSVIVLSQKTYLNITPTFAQFYQNGAGSFSFIQEASLGYQIGPKSLISAYCKRDFKSNITQVSFGYTKYF